ncbi:hypothetical protein AAG570_008541 [Ranatra chinensis]|uniref:Uncharacterized protein n=1 Tax=Ranatra chinensis TaxID=642074 RepID=A0ABD0Z8B0_9HEMI
MQRIVNTQKTSPHLPRITAEGDAARKFQTASLLVPSPAGPVKSGTQIKDLTATLLAPSMSLPDANLVTSTAVNGSQWQNLPVSQKSPNTWAAWGSQTSSQWNNPLQKLQQPVQKLSLHQTQVQSHESLQQPQAQLQPSHQQSQFFSQSSVLHQQQTNGWGSWQSPVQSQQALNTSYGPKINTAKPLSVSEINDLLS